MEIPQDYIEFLYWVKEKTENHWSKKKFEPAKPEEYNDNWIIGAKWVGLDENEISSIEKKYKVTFTPDHKEFLKVLHAIDKKRPVKYYDANDEIYTEAKPYFYNWLTDEAEIRDNIQWPYKSILADIRNNNVWLESWGKRPESEITKKEVFSKWFENSPSLTPISGHQYVVPNILDSQSPVMSMYCSDVVVVGWDMTNYLLFELARYIDFENLFFDEEDQDWYSIELTEIQQSNWELGKVCCIPFWNEMIHYQAYLRKKFNK